MQITLKRISGDFHFEAQNENNAHIELDASPNIGGTNKGFRPMETLLAGLAGCSSIDIVHILKKQKIVVDDIKVVVNAEREVGIEPSLFTHIEITFHLFGNIDKEKAERAVALSLEKYCSVARILEKTATITHQLKIN